MYILLITYQWIFLLKRTGQRNLQMSIQTLVCISVNDTIHIQYTEIRRWRNH